MKNYIYTLLVLVALSSCDSRNDFLANINRSPTISIDGQDVSSLDDTVKVSLKMTTPFKTYVIGYNDPENKVQSVSYDVVQGAAEVYQDNQLLTGGIFNLTSSKTINLKVKPTTVGFVSIIKVTVKDNFGTTSTLTINLYSFNNMLPVAGLALTPVTSFPLSPYEVSLDGSTSIDQDQRFGGGIILYTFVITGNSLNKTINTASANIPFIFPGPGTYTVQLTVKDIDGSTSLVTRNITL